MYFVQLAIEGLKHFSGRSRLGFRGQLDVITLADHKARLALLEVFFHTLFPDTERSDATAELSEPNGSKTRSVLTFSGRDRVPYRLLRDLRTGQSRLFRVEKKNGTHVPLSADSGEIHRYLRVQLQVPDDASFERLFLYAHDARPSLGASAQKRVSATSGGFVPSAPGRPAHSGPTALGGAIEPSPELSGVFHMPSLPVDSGLQPSAFTMTNALTAHELSQDEKPSTDTIDVLRDLTDEELLARHQKLRGEHKRARNRARARRTLSALVEKEREAKEAQTVMEDVEKSRKLAQDAIDAEPTLAEVPRGFRERLTRHDIVTSQYHLERQRLVDEMEQAQAEAVNGSPNPAVLLRNPRTLIGLGGAVLSMIATWLFSQPWFALLQCACGGFAALNIWREIREQEIRSEAQERVGHLEEQLARLERQYMMDTAAIRGILSRLGLDNTEGLGDRLNALDKQTAERDRLVRLLDGQVGHRGRRASGVLKKITERRIACEEILERTQGSAALSNIEHRLKPLEKEIFRRQLRPLDDENDPENIPVIVGTTDLSMLERPASVLGGVLPNYDDEEEDEGYGYGSSSSPWVGGKGPVVTKSLYGDFSESDARGGQESWMCAAPSGGGHSSGLSGSYQMGGGPHLGERVRSLVETASDLVGQDPETTANSVEPRVSRYIEVLTSGEFNRASFKGAGELKLEGPNHNSTYSALEGALLDSVDLGLRFALLESVLKVRRAPVIIEDPVIDVSTEHRVRLHRIYSHLAAMTQVIVLTKEDDIDGHVVQVET